MQPVLPTPPARANPPADQAAAAGTPAPAEETLPQGMIDFRGADLNTVLEFYSKLVNRTLLRPGTLAAANQITLTTQGGLTRKEGIQALEAVLAMNGISIQNVGDKFAKVVLTANAGQVGAPFDTNRVDRLADLGQYVTHIIQVTNVKPSELTQVLQPFASPGNTGIIPIDSSQILVLRDYTENVKRMLEMIKKIDVTLPSEYVSEVIPIKYAKAVEIASALNSLSTGGGGATVGGGTGGTGTRGAGARGGMGGYRQGMGMGMGMGGTYSGMTPGYGTPFGTQGTVTPQAAVGAPGTGTSFSDRLQRIIQKASAPGEIVVLGNTKMIADERTNSLLIYASKEDMKTIKEIIKKLDVVLAQVLIEAVIVQVTLNDNYQMAFSYLQNPNNPSQIGNFNGLGAINNQTFLDKSAFSAITNAGGNVLSGGFNYLATFDNNSFAATVTALASKSNARILQCPRIQTSHNEPAHIFVGESRPYPTGSYYGGGAYGGYSSIQQLPIGVSLDVTPLINQEGLVVMEINQDIESVNGSVNIANVGDVPVTSQKTANTKVSVRDRDTIMLGGLIENSTTKTRSGVPLLMDIPLLGYLFRATTDTKVRNELIVLIRPTVLPTPEVAALTARSEQNKMPLVKRYQAEVQAEEEQRAKQLDKEPLPKK